MITFQESSVEMWVPRNLKEEVVRRSEVVLSVCPKVYNGFFGLVELQGQVFL